MPAEIWKQLEVASAFLEERSVLIPDRQRQFDVLLRVIRLAARPLGRVLDLGAGVTTVGAIRAAGGDVVLSPTRTNKHHATLAGLTPEQASELFRPTVPNPNRVKK